MPFVKLDTSILDSTLWVERGARDLFITALLMAEPWDTAEPMEQIEVRSFKKTGFVVPPGWYGFIPAAGIGIIRRSLLDEKEGYAALEALGNGDVESRSDEFDGRRLVRVHGGYVVLNYMRFREHDYGAAERSKRYRDRKKSEQAVSALRVPVTASPRNVTQADADADEDEDEDAEASVTPNKVVAKTSLAKSPNGLHAGAPPIGTMLCIGEKKSWPLYQTKVDEWQQTYAGVNVVAELRKARQWLIDNPTKRKTFNGMTRFLNSWLAKEQNQVGGRNGQSNNAYVNRAEQRSQQIKRDLAAIVNADPAEELAGQAAGHDTNLVSGDQSGQGRDGALPFRVGFDPGRCG